MRGRLAGGGGGSPGGTLRDAPAPAHTGPTANPSGGEEATSPAAAPCSSGCTDREAPAEIDGHDVLIAEQERPHHPLGSIGQRLGPHHLHDLADSQGGVTRTADLATEADLTEDGGALAKARELADRIARNGPIAVQAVLRVLRETECLPEPEALPIEAKIGMRVFMSEDAKEGPRAFAEKRRPEFKGR